MQNAFPLKHFEAGQLASRRWQASLPWLTVGALLALCALNGIKLQQGLSIPPDSDTLRDLGFIHALLDGNYWGDPSYSGEWRYYPPLVHAFVAVIAHTIGPDLALFWTRCGIWLNLLTPAAFFLMCRRLFPESGAAVAATCFYVLWPSSALIPWALGPWVLGGYTPWPFTPLMAQSLFFITLLTIVTAPPSSLRVRSLLRAALIGLLIGLTALAHLPPAVILSAIVAAVAVVQSRCHPRIIVWLGVVAVVELATAAPYLAPLLHYPGNILNPANGEWIDDLLQPHRLKRIAVLNAPGVLASLIAAIIARRRRDIAPTSLAALLAWISVCGLFILRSYACTVFSIGQARVCHFFVLPVHHYHLYLQDAWACMMGYSAWAVIRTATQEGRPHWYRPVAVVLILATLAVGVRSFFKLPFDEFERQVGLTDGRYFDSQAYRWVLANTNPSDVFLTDLVTPTWENTAAFTIIAAARQLVATPKNVSSPFVDWEKRDTRRRFYLEAGSPETDDGRLCDFRGQRAYFLVGTEFPKRSPRLEPVYASRHLVAYRISTEKCP
jgi:hypothetical protein